MSWQGIAGHDDVAEQFRRSLASGRLAHAFLLVGPVGVGKRTFALKLAQVLLCSGSPPADMSPCGQCESCRLFAADNHPDIEMVSRPAEKSTIPLELLIGRDEKRMREGLCHNLSLKPYLGDRKVALIDDADYLNVEGANCLLKTLEEPPPRSTLFLIGTSPDKQLPTIRSRCQIIRFSPLPTAEVEKLLLAHELVDDAETAKRVAQQCEGSITRAVELADPELRKFRGQLLAYLADEAASNVRFSQVVSAFVDEAGREAAARRDRLRNIMRHTVDFYRWLLRELLGAQSCVDAELQRAVERASGWHTQESSVTACLDRTLGTPKIEQNANLATLIECWIADLARLAVVRPCRATRHHSSQRA